MKTLFLGIICLVSLQFTEAQLFKAGLKGGMNFPSKPQIEAQSSTSSIVAQIKDQSSGFHLGIFTQFTFAGFYLRPEMYYTQFHTDFVNNNNTEFTLTNKRIDVPLLLGIQFLRIIYAHSGIVTSFYMDESINREDFSNINKDDLSFGFQLGGGINIHKFSIELRYETPISNNHSEWINDVIQYQIKSNPSQFIVSAGYRF